MSSSRIAFAVLWSCFVAGGSAATTIDVTPEATWSGDFGLAVLLTDANPAFVETSTPDDELRYVVRFYLNADGLDLGGAESLVLFQGLSSNLVPIISVRIESNGASGKQLVYTVKTDGGEVSTPPIGLVHAWHSLELDWVAATGEGANDGSLATRLDNIPTSGLASLDNDQSSIDLVRWGAVVLNTTSSGSIWLDDFASRRSGPIGPVLAGSLDLDGDGTPQPLTDGLLFLRSIFGFNGVTLTAGAVGSDCQYCTAAQIQSRLVALQAILDIDQNGSIAPLNDGLLILRFLFGFTGSTLTDATTGAGAVRDTPAEVTDYLDSLK